MPASIGFVGVFNYHSGSSQAVLGYVRAGQRLGYDVRVSAASVLDEVVPRQLPIAPVDWQPDLMVFVFESYQLPEAIAAIEPYVPRTRRLVLDLDGKYSRPLKVGGDSNHASPEGWADWTAVFQGVSDTVLQPCLEAVPAGVERFLFHGVQADVIRARRGPLQWLPSSFRRKPYDLVYVGNNWHRWADMALLLEGLTPVRAQLGRIAIFGRYWSGEQHLEFPEATYSDPAFFQTRRVEVHPNVPFGEVESTMGRGRLSPLLMRPVLSALGLGTLRMYETAAADTVPLLASSARHALAIYGPSAEKLLLPSDPAEKVLSILDHYREYESLAREIAHRMVRVHSYDVRLRELAEFCP